VNPCCQQRETRSRWSAGRASKAFCSARNARETPTIASDFKHARLFATSHRLTQQADFASLGDLTARLLTKLEARRRG
jgi:hypothetical protein